MKYRCTEGFVSFKRLTVGFLHFKRSRKDFYKGQVISQETFDKLTINEKKYFVVADINAEIL